MSVIFAESVAITKSGLIKGFNGDNMNLNGKVLTPQEADNGFKAAGRIKPPYYAVLTSGNQQGMAEGAASAFNDYIREINLNKENAFEIISRYFDDMQTVAENCGMEDGNLSVAIVCVYEDCVIAAKTGNCHLLRYSAGELFEIALPDDESSSRGFQFAEIISNGDMFALIGEECSADINYVGIINEFNSDSDLKSKVKSFYKILSENAKDKDCSVILIRVETEEANAVIAAPAGDVVIAEDAYADESVESQDAEAEEAEEPVSLKKKILNALPIVALIIIFGITGALFIATQVTKPASTQESTTVPTTESTTVKQEETSNAASEEKTTVSDDMVNVGDPEQGGNAISPETTTQAPETTTQAPETTTQAPETTTESNTTLSEPVNPETTTQAPENEPVDTPADEPADDSADEPVEEPEDEPVDEIIDQIVEEPVG